MAKYFIVVVFLISSLICLSQNATIDSASVKGKYFLVYADHGSREFKIVNQSAEPAPAKVLTYTEALEADRSKLERYIMPYLLDFDEKHNVCNLKIKLVYGKYPLVMIDQSN